VRRAFVPRRESRADDWQVPLLPHPHRAVSCRLFSSAEFGVLWSSAEVKDWRLNCHEDC
jgi:hypothetical protein